MFFAQGDIADYADTTSSLRIEVIEYREFQREDNIYERVDMKVERIFRDDAEEHSIGEIFFRERHIGAESDWNLAKVL